MYAGSKRKSKGMATEQEVYEAGGQKCIQQNLNIAFVFWMLSRNSPNNQLIVKNIIEFIKGTNVILDNSTHISESTLDLFSIIYV